MGYSRYASPALVELLISSSLMILKVYALTKRNLIKYDTSKIKKKRRH